MAGIYAVKYCGKPEKLTMLETVHAEDTEVVEYLKTRTIGACMAYYRHNGGRIAEMHHDVLFFCFSFEHSSSTLRPLWHRQQVTSSELSP